MTTHPSLSLAKIALGLLRIAYMLRRLIFGSSLESDRLSATWVLRRLFRSPIDGSLSCVLPEGQWSRFGEVARTTQGGEKVTAVCRRLGVSEQTFNRWKKQFSGLGLSELPELRSLCHENAKLKQFVF